MSEVNVNFVTAMKRLHCVVHEKLLTTTGELEERKYYIQKIVERKNKITAIKEKLQVDYNQQINMKKNEVVLL